MHGSKQRPEFRALAPPVAAESEVAARSISQVTASLGGAGQKQRRQRRRLPETLPAVSTLRPRTSEGRRRYFDGGGLEPGALGAAAGVAPGMGPSAVSIRCLALFIPFL